MASHPSLPDSREGLPSACNAHAATGEGCPPKLGVILGERRWTLEAPSSAAIPLATAVTTFAFTHSEGSNVRAPQSAALLLSARLCRSDWYTCSRMPRFRPATTQASLATWRNVAEHNAGRCTHTAKHGPWTIEVVIEFADERRAVAFERYLKSGSGVAFSVRHLR